MDNMRKVIPYHVIIGNNQFAGLAKEIKEFEPMMILKDVVNITYHSPQPGVINRTMRTIEGDNDYQGGNLTIFLGPGVILFKVNEMGEFYKQYLQVKSNIVVPNLVVNGLRKS